MLKILNNKVTKLITLVVIFTGSSCYGQTQAFKSNTKIKANISSYGLNRISFANFDLSEVIGDQSKYQLINDTSSKNIFILPKVLENIKFEVSIINTYGDAQDIEFTVKKIPGQMLLFDNNKLTHQATEIQDQNFAAAHMLRAMHQDVKDKYYVTGDDKKLQTKLNNKFSKQQIPLQIISTKTYRYDNLTGMVLTVKTTSKNGEYHLETKDYENLFAGTILTSKHILGTHNNYLVKKYTYKIYIVTGRNTNDQ